MNSTLDSVYLEGLKLEQELVDTIRERDEARKQRDGLAEALRKVVTSWNLVEWLDENDFEALREVIQSQTPNKPISK